MKAAFLTRAQVLISALSAKGFFHVFGSSVINKVVVFFAGIFLVRMLSIEDFGKYSYAWNIVTIALIFNGLGSSSATMQLASETNNDRERCSIWAFGYRYGYCGSLVVCVTLMSIGFFIQLPVNGSNSILLTFSMLPLFLFTCDMQQTTLRTALENKKFAYGTNINTILTWAGALLGVFALGVYGLAVGRYLAAILSIAVVWHILGSKVILRYKDVDSGVIRKDFLGVSVVSMVNLGLSQFSNLATLFFVGLLIGDANQVAIYQVAAVIPAALYFIPSSIMTFSYPYFARYKDNLNWVRKRYAQLLVGMLIVSVFVIAFLELTSHLLVILIFGEQYAPSVPLFQLLCIGFFASSVLMCIAGNLVVTQRKLMYNTLVSAIALASLVIMLLVLIPKYGLWGAAISQVAFQFIAGIGYTACFCKIILDRQKESQEKTC